MNNGLELLINAARQRELEVVLPAYQKKDECYLRVEVRKRDKAQTIVASEAVDASNDTPERAAKRILTRMRKEKIL